MIEDDRTSVTVDGLKRAFADNLYYLLGTFGELATKHDCYAALAYTVRDRLMRRLLNTVQTYRHSDVRIVSYLSAEYLLGPHLANNISNLGIEAEVRQATQEMGLDLDEILAQEPEPGLGNGGLGRLAACYLESLATLELPAVGYGIRYQFGIFDQEIRDGNQVEVTDHWLRFENPWEIHRPERSQLVGFGGHTQGSRDGNGRYRVFWAPDHIVKAQPYDTPILGYHTTTCNALRLWHAEAPESFDFQRFNAGDYFGAASEAVESENITKVLYPNDQTEQGKELRLKQQYFFVSASLKDALKIHLLRHADATNFHEKFVMQMNDTHPSIGVAELMRLLIDEHDMDWDPAWNITVAVFGYTNHTLLPEALERWPLPMFQRLLPRHLEIIYEINQRFLTEVRAKFPGDEGRVQRMSIMDEGGERYVRMANLATIGSHMVNGVAELHSELLKTVLLRDFFEFSPEKFTNVTNGVTPRRWLKLSNPGLAGLIDSKIGHSWVKDLNQLRDIEPFVDDAQFRTAWREVKRANKRRLAGLIHESTGIEVNPDSMFDIQVKRIHEYKRQHLNVLYVVTLYNLLRQNPELDIVPRTVIFGGKAAPGYFMAKLIIRLINRTADAVNNDPAVGGRLKVVFVPNFEVGLGQVIYPAADLSEQISTAGKEASGTGNMKFAMNGALTIGTLDGANVEIRHEVGPENFFLFGLTAPQVNEVKNNYNPRSYYDSNPNLRGAIDRIGEWGGFQPLIDSLLYRDEYLLFADYQAYLECQDAVSAAFHDEDHWTRMSILNAARMGKFSSDRSIREYAERIWNIGSVKIELKDYVQEETLLRQHPAK
jgi:starch phosphorylase